MKVKVGDLTVKQLHSICQVACKDCPLHYNIGLNVACMTDFPEYDDYKVDIPDDLLAGMAERQTPET